MICLACRRLSGDALCERCRRDLRAAPDRFVDPVLVRSAYRHDGAARQLVHRLKYEGFVAAASVLAPALAPLVDGASALVPIPRTHVRRQRYGVDPAAELAGAIGRLTGLPVVRVLHPAIVGRARAGRRRDERTTARFVVVALPPPGCVIVDDVVTTGGTVGHVGALLGVAVAVTATSADSRLKLGSESSESSQ